MIKTSKHMPVQTRRKFDENFKRQVVANWLSSGKSAEVIAQELGIGSNRLYAWRKRFAPQDTPRMRQSHVPSPICRRSSTQPIANWPAYANNATF